MRKDLIIGFLCLFSQAAFSQNNIIMGRITDDNGHPLPGAVACQFGSMNCNYSDINGIFHLLIDNNFDNEIQLHRLGYISQMISNLDTIKTVINIILYEDPSSNTTIDYDIDTTFQKRNFKFGFITFLQVDFIFNDFSDFEPLLKDYNVDLMNKSTGLFSMEIAGTFKRYYAGLNWGIAFDSESESDSLDVELNTNQFGLHFGYNLLNTKRIILTPKVALKWNRYRLLNNDKDKKIPIEQYVNDRDLDIRFNQMTGFVGFNLSYKIFKSNLLSTDYWTVGAYGGYAFKLNYKPWIYSQGNRLTSNGKIGIENYNVGIFFSFNFDGSPKGKVESVME